MIVNTYVSLKTQEINQKAMVPFDELYEKWSYGVAHSTVLINVTDFSFNLMSIWCKSACLYMFFSDFFVTNKCTLEKLFINAPFIFLHHVANVIFFIALWAFVMKMVFSAWGLVQALHTRSELALSVFCPATLAHLFVLSLAVQRTSVFWRLSLSVPKQTKSATGQGVLL